MIVPWSLVVVVDMLGSVMTMVIALVCLKVAYGWMRDEPDSLFSQYILLLTTALVLFAVSRSFGHLVKQILLLSDYKLAWKSIAPFSGSINTATFIIIFAFGLFFQRIQKVQKHIEEYRDHLEELVEKRTLEVQKINSNLKDEITRRQESEIGLASSLQFQHELIAAIPLPLFYKDRNNRFIGCNEQFKKFFNLNHEEIVGKTIFDLTYKELAEINHQYDMSLFKNQGTQIYEVEAKLKIGESRQVIYHKAPFYDNNGEVAGLIGAILDITEQKNAEKMEAIGIMAGGVAHDLNNILSGIVSYPELLLLQLEEESELRKPIEEIQKSGKRAAAVVSDLLTMSRGVASTKSTTNLNKLIVEYLDSPEGKKIQSSYNNIQYFLNLDPKLSNLSCSAIHIKKCLMNLIINGSESIGNKGEIVISTSNQAVDKTIESVCPVVAGDYCILSVSDTGGGISQQDIQHIFEPFYTRKEMGKSGTGLGLVVVWNTIKDHHGGITVDCDDKGSTFKLYLPATTEKVEEVTQKSDMGRLKGNGEVILVVDDEPLLRDVASQILTSLGYHTVCVDSGEKAVNYLKENKADLVLLDMLMPPGINGRKTYERIVEYKPGQRAVIASGFSDSDNVRKLQQIGAGGFVRKPYSIEQLGRVIQAELKK